MSTYYRLSSIDFDAWFNQEIWVNHCTKDTRKYAVYAFAEELTKWMKKSGYTMDHRWRDGRTVVANWLYRLSIRVKVGDQACLRPRAIVGGIIHRNLVEDQDRFHSVIGSAGIQNFMSKWTLIEDFDTSMPLGQTIQNELEIFLWSYLDLDESAQGNIVLDLIEQDHSDGEGAPVARRVDEYIQDAAEGYHGGVGYKV